MKEEKLRKKITVSAQSLYEKVVQWLCTVSLFIGCLH